MANDIRNSVLSTIVYYDAFGLPLTQAEIYKYLVNPARFYDHNKNFPGVAPADIALELERLEKAGNVASRNGFYFLAGRNELYDQRLARQKIAEEKWKKFLRKVRWLQAAPFLRAVFASGSLAANNTASRSDFDILVIAQAGRLYTARFFLWLISSLLLVRRGRYDLVAPDKLCFNHYLTDRGLALNHRSLFIAQSLANIRPVWWADEAIVSNFYKQNDWALEYIANYRATDEYRSAKKMPLLAAAAKAGEFLLAGKLGNFVEKILRAHQQRRIRKNPATYESGGRVVFNNGELEFHPRSFETFVISNYNKTVKKLGILANAEADSGLVKSQG